MAILKIVKFPDPVLAARAAEVKTITNEERRLVRDMIETMYAENGVGLAANQVGVSKQIFVASADQIRGSELVCFNPRIVRREGEIKEFEGCLSVPECYEPVKRSKVVWLRAMALDGSTAEIKAEGLLARIFQHETDHLNGMLFIDRLGFVKSKLTRKKILASLSPRRPRGE